MLLDSERSTYTQKVDFAKLRSELLNADSTEAQLTRSSHEKIAADLAKLNSRLRDEIGRTQASVRLDLNLEKGRIREEANGQEMRIKETETRIEQEVAGLRERVEAVKFSTLQWLMYGPRSGFWIYEFMLTFTSGVFAPVLLLLFLVPGACLCDSWDQPWNMSMHLIWSDLFRLFQALLSWQSFLFCTNTLYSSSFAICLDTKNYSAVLIEHFGFIKCDTLDLLKVSIGIVVLVLYRTCVGPPTHFPLFMHLIFRGNARSSQNLQPLSLC